MALDIGDRSTAAEGPRQARPSEPSSEAVESIGVPFDSVEESVPPDGNSSEQSEPARFVPRAGYGTVILRSETGSLHGQSATVVVEASSSTRGRFVKPVEGVRWSMEGGEWLGRARFRLDGPDDTLRVRLIGVGLPRFRWVPTEAELTDAQPEATCTCRDAAGTLQLRFDVSTHEVIEGSLDVSVSTSANWGDGSFSRRQFEASDPPLLEQARDVEPGALWVVHVDGFRPVAGDLAELASAHAVGEVVPIQVVLEEGWGCWLQCRTADGRPLEGQRVRIDGDDYGRSDRGGRLLVEGDQPPREVEVEISDSKWLNLSNNARTCRGVIAVTLGVGVSVRH